MTSVLLVKGTQLSNKYVCIGFFKVIDQSIVFTHYDYYQKIRGCKVDMNVEEWYEQASKIFYKISRLSHDFPTS